MFSFRAGSSELVLDQVLFLAEVVSLLGPPSISERTECKFIMLFLQRMCSYLSIKGKQVLIEKYPPSDFPLMWYSLGLTFLPKEIKMSVSPVLVTNAIASIEDFLRSNLSPSVYKKMVFKFFFVLFQNYLVYSEFFSS